jgi:hypothetical protein
VLARQEICKTQKDRGGAAIGFHRRCRALTGADFTLREMRMSMN